MLQKSKLLLQKGHRHFYQCMEERKFLTSVCQLPLVTFIGKKFPSLFGMETYFFLRQIGKCFTKVSFSFKRGTDIFINVWKRGNFLTSVCQSPLVTFIGKKVPSLFGMETYFFDHCILVWYSLGTKVYVGFLTLKTIKNDTLKCVF